MNSLDSMKGFNTFNAIFIIIITVIINTTMITTTPPQQTFEESSSWTFKKTPIAGTYFVKNEQTYGVTTVSKCAMLCGHRKNWVSNQCLAFYYVSATALCEFYGVGDVVVPANNILQIFVMEFKPDVFHSVTTPHNRFSLYRSSMKYNYDGASQHCSSVGGYLLDFTSMDEYAAVKTVLNKDNWGISIFVGADDRVTEGTWIRDRNGQAINESFWRWHPNEPSNVYSDEDCASIINSLLNDMPCFYSEHFICERDLGA